MTLKRKLAVGAMVAAMVGGSALGAQAAPKKCPPGQTATVTVVGVDVVQTCRVL